MPRRRVTPFAAWLLATAVCVACGPRTAPSLDALRAQATEEQPTAEVPSVPRPDFMAELPGMDAALANVPLDRVATAIAPLRDTPDAPPPSPDSAAVISARAQAMRGDLEAAVRGLAEHVRSHAGDLQAWRELARMLDASGRRDLAVDAWSRVLLVAPADAEALGSGGIDAAAVRQPLVAAERLLRLRQMQRLGEAPQPDPGAAIAHTVALGLSLREIGYLRAAATCLREAASATMAATGPDAEAMQRQSGDLQRIAGECLMRAGAMDEAAVSLRAALAATGPEDRVALPRLVWCLAAQGRPKAAALEFALAMQRIDSAGRSGIPQAAQVLATAGQAVPTESLLDGSCDAMADRSRVAMGVMDSDACGGTPVDRLLQDASPWSMAVALGAVAERHGMSVAVDQACARVADRPWRASDVAHALRCLPFAPHSMRQALQQRMRTTTDEPSHAALREAAHLLAAHFELQGGEVELALQLAGGASAPSSLRAAAVVAAGGMEDRARVDALGSQPVDTSGLAAALAEAYAALGDARGADAWAERAIALDDRDAACWLARSSADLVPTASAVEQRDQPRLALSAARLSAERAWEAQPDRLGGARRMLQLAPAERQEQAELRQLMRQAPGGEASLRELDRAEALRRAQQGQGEPVLETLRALLAEDPCDADVAMALVSAAAAAGQLPSVESWIDALRARRPAAPALLEAMVSAKARQGRLLEGVQALREASEAEPESRVRRRAWARGLSVAGRHAEAWDLLAQESSAQAGPRALLERAEFALRADRESIAAELLVQLAAVPTLTDAQRLSALGLALRLSREVPGRRDLLAALGRAAMLARDAGPAALSAAMMAGTEEQASGLALAHAQPWTAVASIESAQRLLDEAMPRRALALLAAVDARAERAERRGLRRAQVAILAQLDDVSTARALLQDTLAQGIQPFLSDAPVSTEAAEWNELAGAFLLADHQASAEALFESALQRDPGLREPLNNLAWLRLSRGTLDDVTRDLVQRALAAGADDPSTLDTVGWWHYLDGAGDPLAQQAVDMLRRATGSREPSLESLDHVGDALWRNGQREPAMRAWRQVVEAASGRGARNRVMEAFDRMQQRLWGVRAWSAASFYDARDGAAIERAQAKLKAVAQGVEPPVAERLTQPPPPAAPAVTVPAPSTSPTSPSTP